MKSIPRVIFGLKGDQMHSNWHWSTCLQICVCRPPEISGDWVCFLALSNIYPRLTFLLFTFIYSSLYLMVLPVGECTQCKGSSYTHKHHSRMQMTWNGRWRQLTQSSAQSSEQHFEELMTRCAHAGFSLFSDRGWFGNFDARQVRRFRVCVCACACVCVWVCVRWTHACQVQTVLSWPRFSWIFLKTLQPFTFFCQWNGTLGWDDPVI